MSWEHLRDASHEDSIRRWVEFVKSHPDSWKRIRTAFINAQYDHYRRVIGMLKRTPEGRQKIVRIYNIRNLEGFSFLR